MSDTPPMPPPPPPSDWEDSEEILPELPEFLPPPDMGGEATVADTESRLPHPPPEDEESPELTFPEENTRTAGAASDTEVGLLAEPPPAPADDESPAHSAPIFPPPIPDDEVSALPPLPPQEFTERKKGTGIAVTLGIAAFFSAAIGFQNQSDNNRIKSENAGIGTQIAKETARQNKIAAELKDINTCEQQLEDAKSVLIKQQEEYNSLKTELAELQHYSHPGMLARDKGRLQESIEVLQRQAAELDGLLEMYLPPSELPEDKLQERDVYIRKFAFLYKKAWNYSAWNLMSAIYADQVIHQLTGKRPTNVRHVIEALRSSKIKAPGTLYSIGYKGLSVELIFKDNYETSQRWYKEKLDLNEQGRIFRWSEEVVVGEQPSLPPGFRSLTVVLQEKQ